MLLPRREAVKAEQHGDQQQCRYRPCRRMKYRGQQRPDQDELAQPPAVQDTGAAYIDLACRRLFAAGA
jgi:hypothetical protein